MGLLNFAGTSECQLPSRAADSGFLDGSSGFLDGKNAAEQANTLKLEPAMQTQLFICCAWS